MKSYKIKDLAKLVSIPESTVRFYRDRHIDFFNSTGTGRNKKYDDDTLKALRLICDRAKRKDTAEDIEEALSMKFTRNIEVNNNSSTATALRKQNSLNFESVDLLARTLERLTDITDRLVKLEEDRNLSWWQKIRNKKRYGG